MKGRAGAPWPRGLLRPTLLRPTLVRRVMLALLIAFALVWLVLLARELHGATDRQALDGSVRELGEQLLDMVAPLDAAGEARAAMSASAALIDLSYRKQQVPGALRIALFDSDGVRLFPAAAGAPLPRDGVPGQVVGQQIDHQPYRVYFGQRGRWQLLVAAPVLPTSWLIQARGGALTIDMLIALPFVVLPLWLAVRRALAPLRKLSAQLDARGVGDLSALVAVPAHAELQPLLNALDDLLGQLRHQRAREQAFVQDAAHELRTPMAVLAAQAHVLAAADDGQQRTAAAQHMTQALARAAHLTKQLLDLARIDATSSAPGAAPVDLAALLRQALAQRAPAALARGIDLSLDAPDSYVCLLEAAACESIINNLLDNALAYVPDQARIAVHLQAGTDSVLLRVADDGPGIALAERALIFERFYRGSGHAAPGAGLGLAIVREAAQRLGGSVDLGDGIDGRGCGLTVLLPAAACGHARII